MILYLFFFFFFFNDTATTEIYTTVHTLSLHDALPILRAREREHRTVVARPPVEWVEREADVVAERNPVHDPAPEPASAFVQKGQPLGALAPRTARELVLLVAGLAAEQLHQVQRGRRHDMDGDRRG